jgi:cell division protein FtsW (lipid II flippase)
LTATYLEETNRIRRREAWLLGLAFGFICLAAVALNLSTAARLEDWDAIGGRWISLVVLPVWGGGAFLIRRELDRRAPRRDPLLLPIALLLVGWGMLLIWRLTPAFAVRQTVWFVLGAAVLIAILRSPPDLRWLRRYRYLWLSVGILLTSLTLLFGTSPTQAEPRLWLGFRGLYLQPSELLRLLLIAYLASYFADRLTRGWWEKPRQFLRGLAPLLIVWGLSIGLLIAQRDLGTGTLFLGLLAVLLYLATGRWQVLLAAGLFVALGGLLGYGLFGVVRLRVQAWLNPWLDPIGGSYQIVQSLISLASGGVFGRGPGLGAPSFVPAAHTDFIFSAVVEEWGLLGGLAMIGLYAVLVTRGLRVALRSRDPFAMLLAAGLTASLGLQAVLIIGGVIRLLPLTGLTLPFVSYGGSSLVTSLAALAFLLLLSSREAGKNRFAFPMRRLQIGMHVAWLALALALGWWTIYRAPALTGRTDNARRGLASLYSRRGSILDDQGRILAESVGERGSYQRHYPQPESASVVGYDSLRYGQAGIERFMDEPLRGMAYYDPLVIWWEYVLRGMPPPGLDVLLTLDAELQEVAWNALEDHRGAVVLIDVARGEILAMASAPSYDPNRLEEDWARLVSIPEGPLIQRATQGRYQPGTALAPFLLAWAEAQGIDGSREAVDFSLPVVIEDHMLTCAKPLQEGEAGDYDLALQRACPAALALLGEGLGGEVVVEMVTAFGLDRSPSLRMASAPASDTLMPPEGDLLTMESVGQGMLTVTPMSVARALASLLNGGSLPPLHIVEAVRLPDDSWQYLAALEQAQAVVSEEVAERVMSVFANQEGDLEFAAMALTGAEGEQIAWYVLGLVSERQAPLLMLVVLEDAAPDQARGVGQEVRQALVEGGFSAGEGRLSLSLPAFP